MEKPMITNDTIKDDVYIEIDDEFEQIRTALGMYISKLGTEGAYHIIHELTNNEFDEAVNPEALSRDFGIVFDEIEQSFSTEDSSRGIPFEKLVDVCTKKHTSTKFVRDDEKMKDQAGRNGVGLVVSAACASYFSMASYRGNEYKLVEIKDGEIVEHKPKRLKNPQHGLVTKFIPSATYLKGPVNMEAHQIQEYLRKMSYIMREDLSITYREFAKDMDEKKYAKGVPSSTIKYKRTGLKENVKYLSSELAFSPVEVVSITDDFDIEIAFSYDNTIEETLINSYCNYIVTTEGGYHETVSLRAICEYFCREAKRLDPNAKYEVTFDDCRKGLILCVNCRHRDPAFEGQHKSRVSNQDVLKEGKKGISEALINYFNSNNGLLRRIIGYLRTIAKVRMEAHKIKVKTLKKQTTFIDDAEMRMFYPLADRNYDGYTEIFIAEGDSAGVAVDTARNSRYQAVFGVMGVVDNIYDMTVTKLMTACRVFSRLVNVLGCGIGKDFDITKLRYTKIIIMADADTDGSNITSLLLLFFFKFLPELIKQGRVYKAMPPLLILNEKVAKKWWKGSMLLYSKGEYYEVINKIIVGNTDIALSRGDNDTVTKLTKKEYLKWLNLNSQYTSELRALKDRAACNPIVLEYVCYAKMVTEEDNSEFAFKEMIENHFDEITYDLVTRLLSGSLDGESISLIADEVFWRGARRFMKQLRQNESITIFVKNKNVKSDTFDITTIGQFLFSMEDTFKLKIQQRYKGIGEMDPDVIFATALNPKVRRLIRFNISDMKYTEDTFKLLHERSALMREARRQLLNESDVSIMDLDN